MKEDAVIDRFEDDKAVLLVGKNQTLLVVDRKQLPELSKEGDWLEVELENDEVISAVQKPETTEQKKKAILEKMERLRKGDHLK